MTGHESTTEPSLRRDAAANRNRILAAATQAFAAQGCAADVRDIAFRAEVGMGTLYRHFATKQTLLDEVLAHDVEAWIDTARAWLSEKDAWVGLRAFLLDALTRQIAHRGLREHFASLPGDPPGGNACRRQMYPVIADLVARAHIEGSLRDDVTTDDLWLLLIGLGRITEALDPPTVQASGRYLDLVLDGLRSDPTEYRHRTGAIQC
jgi:AcrR family transcriptional regulator